MNLAGRALRAVVGLCCRHPRPTVVAAFVLAVLSAGLAWTRLGFEASPLHLLPSGQPYVTRYRDYSRDFGELDEIVVAIRATSLTDAKAFAARLVADLKAGPIAFNHLAYRVAPPGFDGRALLYLPLEDLRALRDHVIEHRDFVESFVASPGLVTLFQGAHGQFARAFVGRFFDLGLQDTAPAADLGFATTLLTQLRDAIVRPELPATPWGAMFPIADDHADAGYFLSDDRQLLFLLADPVGGSGGFTNDRAAIHEIRARIAGLRAEIGRASCRERVYGPV